MDSSTTHQLKPELEPIRGQVGGKMSQKVKPKKKRNVEGPEESSVPKSVPPNLSAPSETSIGQDAGEDETLTIIPADGGRPWTFNDDFLIRESDRLRNIITTRKGKFKGLARQGKSNTFKLKGVGARHFSLLLSALRAGPDFNFSLDDLKIILTLASDWGFSRIQDRSMTAIQNLRLHPVDKLLLARRCHIIEWICEAYLTLALRGPGLETADAPALGTKTTCIIALAREKILLHRLRTLTFEDQTSQILQCVWPSEECREALCEVRLLLLEKKTEVPEDEREQARLVLQHASWLGHELCDNCKADAAIARSIRVLDEEISAAKRVFADQMGRKPSEWVYKV
ncbi:hypothetical protein FRC01_001716 [Tulasnella sp. 417]|nr:hypothetical protein FRC01_001716 [Tulasnella sp. 417]